MNLKETIVLLCYQVSKAFCCTKGLYEMKIYDQAAKPPKSGGNRIKNGYILGFLMVK